MVKRSVDASGTESITRTPVKDTVVIYRYWLSKTEQVGIAHANAAAQALISKQILDQATSLKVGSLSPLDTLTQAVCSRMQGQWDLNGKALTIAGQTATIDGKQYSIKALCLQWIILLDTAGKMMDLYWIQDKDIYVSACGDVLKRKIGE